MAAEMPKSSAPPQVPQPAGEAAVMAEVEGTAPTGEQGSFASLSHLRRTHAEMLRRYRSDKASLGVPEIQAFLQQAQATGNHIAADEARSNAQGILDYWYGVFVMTGKETESSAGPPVLDEYLPSTAPAESPHEEAARNQQALRTVAAAFDSSLPPESGVRLRQLLLRLVRMSDSTSTKVDRAQLLLSDPFLADAKSVKLMEQLESKGLVQLETTSTNTSGGKAYVLSDASLLNDWPTLKELADQRRSLREMASGWEKSGRKEEALLPNGRLLEGAVDYVDLNTSEQEFVTKSQQYASEVRKGKLILLSSACIVLAALSVFLWMQNGELQKKKEELEQQIIKAEAATKKAEAATKEVQEAKAQSEAEAKAQKKRLEVQLDAANKSAADLRSIIDAGKAASTIISSLKDSPPPGLSEGELQKLQTTLSKAQSSIQLASSTAESSVTTASLLEDTTGKATVVAQDAVAVPQQPRLVKTLEGHKALNAVAFALDGRLATADEDNIVRVWSPSGDRLEPDIQGSSKDGVNCIAFSPDGRLLAIGSNGSTVRIYDFNTRETRAFEGHKDSITSVAFSPDGVTLLSASGDRTVQIWDVGSLKVRQKFGPLPSIPTGAALNAAGTQVVASLDDPACAAYVWTLGGSAAPVILQTKSRVKGAQFNLDGTLIVTADVFDNEAVIWDVKTGEARARLKHDAHVLKAIFDPTGGRVATASADGTVRLWSVAEGTLIRTLAGHKGEVSLLAFSPSGKVLLSGGADATARLWFDGETEARYTLTGHTAYLTAVAFNIDGSQIATGSHDSTVRLWDLKDESKPESAVGWSLYGWLDVKADQPTLRAQSFAPQTGSRTAIPTKGSVVTSEAFMNIRDSITAGPDKRWQQGRPVGVLLKGESVEVLDVQADPKAHPPAVWIKFKRK